MRGRVYHRIYRPVDIATCLSAHQTNLPTMTTSESISARIRAIRIAKGLSLSDVEKASHKKIKAVVLGSYERGDRSLSVSKAITIAEFYAVPLTYLLETPTPSSSHSTLPVIDLRALRAMSTNPSLIASSTRPLQTIITFISGVIALRNDWNGEVLSMRSQDLTALSLAIGISHDEVNQILAENNLLLKAK